VFEGDAVDALKTLEALNPTERGQAQDIVNHVYTSPGVPLPKGTDQKIVKVLIQVGVIDYSKITTRNTSKGVYFPTAPNAWGVLAKTSGNGAELSQDLIDDAKLFVNSLRYGEYYSTSNRGKIFSPYLIVNAGFVTELSARSGRRLQSRRTTLSHGHAASSMWSNRAYIPAATAWSC
jgi:hypothetical protein